MAYDELLADRIRHYFNDENVGFEIRKMMGGLCFMVDDKMCVGALEDRLMVRIDKDRMQEYLKKTGARPMDFTGRPMKSFLFVEAEGVDTESQLEYWLNEALAFNPKAKRSRKRKPKK